MCRAHSLRGWQPREDGEGPTARSVPLLVAPSSLRVCAARETCWLQRTGRRAIPGVGKWWALPKKPTEQPTGEPRPNGPRRASNARPPTLPRVTPGRRETQWESTAPPPSGRMSKKKGPSLKRNGPNRCAGGDVLSHQVAPAVPSARQSLTTVFEMGTGVSSALRPPAASPATSIETVKLASNKQKGRE